MGCVCAVCIQYCFFIHIYLPGQPQSNYLREVDIDVITNAECAKQMSGTEADYKTMICAGKTDGSAGGCMVGGILFQLLLPRVAQQLARL